jgi:hypothetical protein
MRLRIQAAGVLAVALALVAIPVSADARPQPTARKAYVYDVRQADVDELVRFQGDPATCGASGLCGYAGTVHYSFHGRGAGAFAPAGRRERFGSVFGLALGSGRTTSDVALADGAGGPHARCTDTATFRADGFAGQPGRRRVTIALHETGPGTIGFGEAQPDYLNTHCAGPRDRDMIASHATPSRNYAVSRFRRRRFAIVFADTQPFRAGGFQGTVRFRVTFGLVRKFTEPLAEPGPIP